MSNLSKHTRISTGTYINVWGLTWQTPDIYVLPNEVNVDPSLDEIDTIAETVENWSKEMDKLSLEDWESEEFEGKDELDILEEMLDQLNLACLSQGFTVLRNF